MWAQPRYQWSKGSGAAITVTSTAITLDKDGNVFTTGYFEGMADFDPGAGTHLLQATGSKDMFVQKLDNNGNFIWAVRIGPTNALGSATGNSVKTDKYGNVCIAGSFVGFDLDFDPGVGQNLLSSSSMNDYSGFVLKLNSAGQFLWVNGIAGTGSVNAAELEIDRHGNVFTCGSFTLNADFDPGAAQYNISSRGEEDGFVQKTDSAGNFIWAFNIGGKSYDHATAIALDTSGNAYIGGAFRDTVDFDPNLGVVQRIGVYGYDRFIIKVDGLGNLAWASTNTSVRSETIKSVSTDTKGYAYATGYNDVEFMITKYDTSGTIIWDRKINGGGGVTYSDIATDIAVDDTGNVYTCGYFTGIVDFDPGVSQFLKAAAGNPQDGITDVFVLKLNNAGTFKWVLSVGSTGPDEANGICLDKWNDIYCTGIFDGTVDFNPSSGIDTMAATGYTDMFVLKLGQCENTYATVSIAGCDSALLNGISYFESGTYTQTIINSRGCDSVITVNISIQRNVVPVTAVLCAGDTFHFGESSITQAGMYYDTLSNIYGCDSVIQLTINQIPLIAENVIDTICYGEVYSYNGDVLTETGEYPYVFTSSITGCDSIVTIKLHVRAKAETLLEALICNSDNYNFGGQLLNTAGVYTDTFSSINGCDSVVILNLEKRLFNRTAIANGNVCVAEEDSVFYQWAECLNGTYNIIDGATQQTFIAPSNGSYRCILYNEVCEELTNCVTVTGIGINNISDKPNVNIYPNPSKKTVTINHSYTGIINLQLISPLGDVVKEIEIKESVSAFDISGMADGIYILLMYNNKEVVYSTKLIKQ